MSFSSGDSPTSNNLPDTSVGGNLPIFFSVISNTRLYSKEQRTRGELRGEQEKVDQRLIPYQRPLGPNDFVEPPPEKDGENLQMDPNTACLDENMDVNRAVPVAANFTAKTIILDDDPLPSPVPSPFLVIQRSQE